MNSSSFIQSTGQVYRLALLALAVAAAGGLQAKEKWYVSDSLGNTVASVNADAVVAEVESTAFGESRTPTAGARFTGKPYDADLGAHVFPFRNYRSDAGRWTSADPSGFKDGLNDQFYSPKILSQVDPMGLWMVQISSINNPVAGHSVVDTGFWSGDKDMYVYTAMSSSFAVGQSANSISGAGQSDVVVGVNYRGVNVYSTFNVTVDSSGNLSVAETSGVYEASDGDLQGAAAVSTSGSGHSITVQFRGGGTWDGTGLTGATYGSAGITWENGHGTTVTMASITFIAVE